MIDLLDKLKSLDALNSWVRSQSGRAATASPQKRIYEAKRMALLDATRLLGAKHYSLTVPAKCRDCGGTGRYTDTYGREFDHCWRCGSKGWVRLEFVESHVAEGIRWHSPKQHAWDLPIASELSFVSSDWDVNKPGIDLTPDAAARHLLVIDSAWPPRYPNSHDRCREHCDCTDRYSLYVGRWDHHCAHCGSCDPKYNFRRRIGRVECTLMACESCYTAKRGIDLFEADIPPMMMGSWHISNWINANNALASARRVA